MRNGIAGRGILHQTRNGRTPAEDIRRRIAGKGMAKMKRSWIAAILFAVIFVSCEDSKFTTEIKTCPADLKYEIRFDGETVDVGCGNRSIRMSDDIECIAVKILEREKRKRRGRHWQSPNIRQEMWMSRSWDNAIFFGGDRCVSVAETDSIGLVLTVCRSGFGEGCE